MLHFFQPFYFFFTSLSPYYFIVILLSSFLYIFFLYLNFSSPYFPKIKNKTFLLPISSRTYWYTSSNLSLSFLPLYLPHYFTVILPSSFLYFDSFSTYFILYKFDIIFPFNPYFFHTKLWVLSFSVSLLSFGEFLFFLITLIKFDIYIYICVCVCVCVCFGIMFFC